MDRIIRIESSYIILCILYPLISLVESNIRDQFYTILCVRFSLRFLHLVDYYDVVILGPLLNLFWCILCICYITHHVDVQLTYWIALSGAIPGPKADVQTTELHSCHRDSYGVANILDQWATVLSSLFLQCVFAVFCAVFCSVFCSVF